MVETSFFKTLVFPLAESALKDLYSHAVKANEKVDTKGVLVVLDKTGTSVTITAIGQLVRE